jgi:AcrR family transcriptional regulator
MIKKPNGTAREKGHKKLLHAAIEAFASQGFDAASTRAIADQAGVNMALISYHFGGKEGLYDAVLQEWAAALQETINREHSAIQPGGRHVYALIQLILRYMTVTAPGVTTLIARESVTAHATPTAQRTTATLQPIVELLDRLLPASDSPIQDGATFLSLLLRLAAPMPALETSGAPEAQYERALHQAQAILSPSMLTSPSPSREPASPSITPVYRSPQSPDFDFVD